MNALSGTGPALPTSMVGLATPLASLALAGDPALFRRSAHELLAAAEEALEEARLFRLLGMKRLDQQFEASSADEAEAFVMEMLGRERQAVHLRRQARLAMSAMDARAKRDERTWARPVIRKMDAALNRLFLEYSRLFRDMRWHVMALRAEAEPEVTGSILSTTEELAEAFRHLETE